MLDHADQESEIFIVSSIITVNQELRTRGHPEFKEYVFDIEQVTPREFWKVSHRRCITEDDLNMTP